MYNTHTIRMRYENNTNTLLVQREYTTKAISIQDQDNERTTRKLYEYDTVPTPIEL